MRTQQCTEEESAGRGLWYFMNQHGAHSQVAGYLLTTENDAIAEVRASWEARETHHELGAAVR